MAIRKVYLIMCCVLMAIAVQAWSGQLHDGQDHTCQYSMNVPPKNAKDPTFKLEIKCGKDYRCTYVGKGLQKCAAYNTLGPSTIFRCFLGNLNYHVDAVCKRDSTICPRLCKNEPKMRKVKPKNGWEDTVLNQDLGTYDEMYGDRYDDSYNNY